MNKPTGEEIIEFIHSHWKNQTCPMCGGRTWNVSDKVFELREFNDGNFVLGGPNSSIVPLIPVTCDKCVINRIGKKGVTHGKNGKYYFNFSK